MISAEWGTFSATIAKPSFYFDHPNGPQQLTEDPAYCQKTLNRDGSRAAPLSRERMLNRDRPVRKSLQRFLCLFLFAPCTSDHETPSEFFFCTWIWPLTENRKNGNVA